ncbi:hypothetical protein [Actinokineospora bangkokensis]|uniref:Uncharacterized protein n=1 Tax=Actinokineospora bangkokensis TaxID=1193682 RepID=A0A1Q9LJ26_9PSEU|nr:hypothetical protein [Actinokineospora bangkokensis]OLR92051.1 hypothetical protein BJP25_22090 [Actinokineospora bangkokensis]
MHNDEAFSASLGEVGTSVTAFARAAADGGFAVNEAGGRALVEAISRMQDWVELQQLTRGHLEQEPKLGSSTGAAAMKPYLVEVATDARGFLTQLAAFGRVLAEAREAVEVAMGNYRRVDESGARALDRDGG